MILLTFEAVVVGISVRVVLIHHLIYSVECMHDALLQTSPVEHMNEGSMSLASRNLLVT